MFGSWVMRFILCFPTGTIGYAYSLTKVNTLICRRGMGGQQAMHDTADILPLILQLAEKSATPQGLEYHDFKAACDKYETGMIPRAFSWVQKSGGANFVVCWDLMFLSFIC